MTTSHEEIGAMMYRVFQLNDDGQKVFEYLCSKYYDGTLYTKTDPYDTIYRLGQRDLMNFIIKKMGMTQTPLEEANDE